MCIRDRDILIINSIFEEDEITLIKYLGERFSSCKEEFKILDIDIVKNIKTNIGEEYRSLIVAVDIVRNIRGFEDVYKRQDVWFQVCLLTMIFAIS